MKSRAILPFILQGTLWWLVMRPFLMFFADFKVEGIEHVKSLESPVIFAPNHSHSLDAELLPLALPFWGKFSPMFYVAKEAKYYSGWRNFVFRTFDDLRIIGSYPIKNNTKNYSEALKSHIRILKEGNNMCIFPEGGTSKDGKIRDAHGGVVCLSMATRKTVVPVLISGTIGINFKSLIAKKHTIKVEFLSPLSFEYLSNEMKKNNQNHKETAQVIVERLRSARAAESVV